MAHVDVLAVSEKRPVSEQIDELAVYIEFVLREK